jgi:hypothetical protein
MAQLRRIHGSLKKEEITYTYMISPFDYDYKFMPDNDMGS